MTPEQLTGRTDSHVRSLSVPPCVLHRDAARAFIGLKAAAAAAGFDLVPVSAFRDFGRQLTIWNGKFSGERPLLDAHGRSLQASNLSPEQRVAAILAWSALPGASRHHWGTELDLIDAAAVVAGQRVALVPAEFASGGPFAPLLAWLERHAARHGFFRPYRGIRSGVQAEPWHFSFAPVAEYARRRLTPAVLRDALQQAPLQGRETVMAQLDELHARYVEAVDLP